MECKDCEYWDKFYDYNGVIKPPYYGICTRRNLVMEENDHCNRDSEDNEDDV